MFKVLFMKLLPQPCVMPHDQDTMGVYIKISGMTANANYGLEGIPYNSWRGVCALIHWLKHNKCYASYLLIQNDFALS